MSTPTPPASPAAGDTPAKVEAYPGESQYRGKWSFNVGTPGSLPWEWAARELAQSLGPGSTAEVVRCACEQWARYACENWRRHDAEMHTALAAGESQCDALRAQLALCRAVLEECRPMVKARLCSLDAHLTGDDSILTRIEVALKGGAS